jgi:hypothetical protein
MKRLLHLSTVPVYRSMAISPIGLTVSGGPNLAFTSWMN